MDEKILLVDDDPNILNGYRRSLRKLFKLRTAIGAESALTTLEEEGPFAVVITDMKMPGMDGLQFLAEVRKNYPETVRIMLTGHADLQTAMDAINGGAIFRFLTKPCTPEKMSQVIRISIEQYRLLRSDKDLLDKTVKSSVKVLTDILSLVNPTAFGRASRIRRYVLQLAEALHMKDTWVLELSAMLSQIGFVALSPAILDKVYIMEKLTDEEWELYKDYPLLGADLIREIPRLEMVADIIERQLWDFSQFPKSDTLTYEEKLVALDAQILRVVMSFDERISRGLGSEAAIAIMEHKPEKYSPQIVKYLKHINTDQEFSTKKQVRVEELTSDMITLEEIRSTNGTLLVPKYQEITSMIIERLVHHKKESGIKEPFTVAYNEL